MKMSTIIVLILCIASLIVIYFLVDKGNSCIKDPFTYGAKLLYKRGYYVFCSCMANNELFTFDKDGIIIKEEKNINKFFNFTV